MKETLEKLWNELFAEECALISSKEEGALVKKAAEMHKTVDALLTMEQREAVEEYIEAVYEMQDFSVKKAFFKGCEFAVSFFFDTDFFGKE
ncbi:MAG: hypothetical protein J6K61_05340 [Clostridia bacterium]|nr:hypothetical protein [Clostridia bacterium]